MYNIDWDIRFNKDGKKSKLGIVEQIEIECSVDNLADTANITLPEAVFNIPLDFENKVARGTEILIRLGYNGNMVNEFTGYVLDIRAVDSSLKIVCEDALFLFRKDVKDVELKPTTLAKIAQYVVNQIDRSYTVKCDYGISYEKFVIHQATGYDVLKKLVEETKANIYFNTEKKELHIHAPYLEKGGDVSYSMQMNIETSSLEYKRASDKKIEVTVESTDLNGKVKSITTGSTGGDKTTIKVAAMSDADMKKIGNAELLKRSYDGYDGTFDAWLVPFVQPTYTARIKDIDYPDKTGRYYVVSVKTSVSASGAVRTITPGLKLS